MSDSPDILDLAIRVGRYELLVGQYEKAVKELLEQKGMPKVYQNEETEKLPHSEMFEEITKIIEKRETL